MTRRATGTFEVRLTPPAAGDGEAPGLGRLLLDKQFQGDLEGASQGQMLAARTGITDSAGYVALERVTGTLHGRRGTFVLQHHGIMARGVQQLTITVVPDSGTEALEGLAGQMAIRIEDGQHSYTFEYTLHDNAA